MTATMVGGVKREMRTVLQAMVDHTSKSFEEPAQEIRSIHTKNEKSSEGPATGLGRAAYSRYNHGDRDRGISTVGYRCLHGNSIRRRRIFLLGMVIKK